MDTRRTGILKYHILFVMIGVSILLSKTMSGTSWTRTYGGPQYDAGSSVIQTQDEGYLVVGTTCSYGAGNRDLWIIRTDSLGDTLWTRTYGGSEGDDGGYIISTSDGYYLLMGSTKSYGAGFRDAWLLKIDSTGDTLWTHTYGGNGVDHLSCVVETPDNGYLLVGGIQSGEYTNDLWLVKTDSLGDTICTRTYRPEGDSYCAGHYIVPTQDGNYIVLGERTPFAMESIWLLKVNSLGDTLWTQTYGGETCYDIGSCLVGTEDGGYLIIGETFLYGDRPDLWLIKTDSLGDTLWTRVYGSELGEGGYFITPTEDGCYIILGYIEPLDIADIWFLKVDASGDILWTRAYGGASEDWGYCVRQTLDGGYIIVGDTHSYGEGNADVWLIKTDSLGYVGVEEGKPNLNILWESYPNPFSRWVSVRYNLPVESIISTEIYDMAGRLVKRLNRGL
ncbi:hypothetical protein CH333_02535, partial [candidate division WOR-3 bacterium JGI_Cruoil_03_44_89]